MCEEGLGGEQRGAGEHRKREYETKRKPSKKVSEEGGSGKKQGIAKTDQPGKQLLPHVKPDRPEAGRTARASHF